MEKGDNVKIVGTRLKGKVIDMKGERNVAHGTSSKILYVTVEHEDGSNMDYQINEVRRIE